MLLASLLGTFSLAYFIGSIPFGLLLVRLAGLGDVRKIGSGNIGATNVMRTGHKGLGIATLLLDGGKGYLAVWCTTMMYGQELAPLAGLIAVLGHVFPVWLRYQGGKGVATTLGVFFAINPLFGLAVVSVWIIVFSFTRISALASLISIGYSSVMAYLIDNYFTALLCLNLALLIVFTHRGNIERMLKGTENRFGAPRDE